MAYFYGIGGIEGSTALPGVEILGKKIGMKVYEAPLIDGGNPFVDPQLLSIPEVGGASEPYTDPFDKPPADPQSCADIAFLIEEASRKVQESKALDAMNMFGDFKQLAEDIASLTTLAGIVGYNTKWARATQVGAAIKNTIVAIAGEALILPGLFAAAVGVTTMLDGSKWAEELAALRQRQQQMGC